MREHLKPEPYIRRRARDVCAVCAHMARILESLSSNLNNQLII